jgi:hypothetical protein
MSFFHLPCHGPVWDGQDWSRCYREEVLDKAIPLAIVIISFIILLFQRMSSKRRKAASAQRIAKLDPASSHIQIVKKPPTNRRQSTTSSNGRARAASNAQAASNKKPGSSASDLAIFHTENAVILNEVHNIMKERYYNPLDPDSFSSQVPVRLSSRAVERVKRVWELVGSTLSASACAAAVALGQGQMVWLVVWVSKICKDRRRGS